MTLYIDKLRSLFSEIDIKSNTIQNEFRCGIDDLFHNMSMIK